MFFISAEYKYHVGQAIAPTAQQAARELNRMIDIIKDGELYFTTSMKSTHICEPLN